MDKNDSRLISILKKLGRPPEERLRISGILTGSEDMTSFHLSHLPEGSANVARLLEELGDRSLNIKFMVHNSDSRGECGLVICVDSDRYEAARRVLEPILDRLPGYRMKVNKSVQVISIYPHREDPLIAGDATRALTEAGVECLAVGTAGSVISLLIAKEDLPLATETLETTFRVG